MQSSGNFDRLRPPDFSGTTDYVGFAGDGQFDPVADSAASVSLLSVPVLGMVCQPLFSLRPICTSILGTRTK